MNAGWVKVTGFEMFSVHMVTVYASFVKQILCLDERSLYECSHYLVTLKRQRKSEIVLQWISISVKFYSLGCAGFSR